MVKKHLKGKHNLNYHIVFCPKYRKPVLIGNISLDCESIIKNISENVNCKVEKISVMPDHVHVFISCDPKISPHNLVKKIKGATSRFLRKKYSQLLKLPCLWSSSYYVGSIGYVSEETVKKYIENQKGV